MLSVTSQMEFTSYRSCLWAQATWFITARSTIITPDRMKSLDLISSITKPRQKSQYQPQLTRQAKLHCFLYSQHEIFYQYIVLIRVNLYDIESPSMYFVYDCACCKQTVYHMQRGSATFFLCPYAMSTDKDKFRLSSVLNPQHFRLEMWHA